MIMALKIGDRTQDDSLVVLDEDRLCYSVKSVSNGGVGVRTISKALLAEWVEAYKQTPNAPSQTVREQLVGKSEIDRFEYGYAGTLAKMAKMVLGQLPVVHPSAEEQRQKAFYDWMISIGKAPKTALDNSRTYLPSISDEMVPPVKNIWHGLREYLYGEKPAKKLYELSSFEELMSLYSGIDRVFGSDSTPGPFDPIRFAECWNWAHSPDNHNSVSASWGMFKKFMQWHDTQKPSKEPPSKNVDLLSVALKVFEENRYEEEWQGKTKKDGYQNIYAMANMAREQIGAGSLDDFYDDFLLKIWAFKNGGSRKYSQLDEAGKIAYRQFVLD